MREPKHAVVQRVETCERDELEFVAHRAQFPLKFRYGCEVELLLPVKRRRAVVGQKLVGKLRFHSFGEALRLSQTWRARFTPDHVGIRSIADGARDGLVEPRADAVETFRSALAGEELVVAFVDI